MTFDEIPIRMRKLGVDRAWLMAECRYSKSTLANILAPKGSNRNERALETIWEALDREEQRQSAPALPSPLNHKVVLEPTNAQFDKWSAAFKHSPYPTFTEWAKAGLDSIAAEEFKLSSVAESGDPVSLPKIRDVKYPATKRAKPRIQKLDREEEA